MDEQFQRKLYRLIHSFEKKIKLKFQINLKLKCFQLRIIFLEITDRKPIAFAHDSET